MEFKATHVITVRWNNGITEYIPVMRDGDCLYTEDEWNAADAADWTVDEDGNILFQGQVPVCLEYCCKALREDKNYTLRDLLTAYKKIVGKEPSERTVDALPDDCNQEDFESIVDSFRIEREVLDDEKAKIEEAYQNQFRD